MSRRGVSGWMFLLVPAHPGRPRQRVVCVYVGRVDRTASSTDNAACCYRCRDVALDSGAHWRQLLNTMEQSWRDSYAALCHITHASCY